MMGVEDHILNLLEVLLFLSFFFKQKNSDEHTIGGELRSSDSYPDPGLLNSQSQSRSQTSRSGSVPIIRDPAISKFL